jgi:hypothetical protein
MRLAIMQPYFLPYIGYWQLMASVDVFVVYDNIKYTKKGWINRNRMLVNGQDKIFTLPLKGDSDHLDVVQRELAGDFDRRKLLNQFAGAYRRAPYFEQTWPLLETVIQYGDNNLFRYILHSIEQLCSYLGIGTRIQVSSGIPIDHSLKAQDKVLAICEALGATTYINAIGGTELYDGEVFANRGVELRFIKARPFEYPQFGAAFVPWLSIVDVLMFNPKELARARVLACYDVIRF